MLCAASVRALLPSSAFILPDCAACVCAPPALGEGICDFYCQNGSFQIYLPALVQFYQLVQCMRLLWPLCPWLPSGLCGPSLWAFWFVFFASQQWYEGSPHGSTWTSMLDLNCLLPTGSWRNRAGETELEQCCKQSASSKDTWICSACSLCSKCFSSALPSSAVPCSSIR